MLIMKMLNKTQLKNRQKNQKNGQIRPLFLLIPLGFILIFNIKINPTINYEKNMDAWD